uniref:Uncharacterized protein n=1 Tax=Anguilla anguilla TaxID=7936 RepID=A0A0E9VUL0_ANGAN
MYNIGWFYLNRKQYAEESIPSSYIVQSALLETKSPT